MSSRASRHFEKAVVLPTPEPLPAQLEPVGQWLDKFTFVNLVSDPECTQFSTRFSSVSHAVVSADALGHVQDRTGASQLAQSIPELAGQVDHPKLDAALLELLARIAKLSIIPVSANARDDDGLGQHVRSAVGFATRADRAHSLNLAEAAELLERDRFLQAAPVLLELALALAQALSLPEGGGALPTATTGARAELVVAFGPFTDRHAPFWSANPDRSAASKCIGVCCLLQCMEQSADHSSTRSSRTMRAPPRAIDQPPPSDPPPHSGKVAAAAVQAPSETQPGDWSSTEQAAGR